MSNQEITRDPLIVGDVTYKVVEIVWPDDRRTFDVYRGDELLTGNKSLDPYPTDVEICGLLDPDDPDNFPRSGACCNVEIVLTPEGWQHDGAPWFWGDDHEADPH
jgi:hypothetical protein